MGRQTTSTSFVTPIKSDGTVQEQSAVEFGRGAFTLLANTTYYFPVGGQDAFIVSAHMRWDASIVITTITFEDCDFPPGTGGAEVTDFETSSEGAWIDEDPSTAFVGTKGAGVTVTSGVVAVAGGAKGGCRFNVDGQGARRSRLAVVVGGTGGEVVCSTWGKG